MKNASLRSLHTQILLDAVDVERALDDGLGMGAMAHARRRPGAAGLADSGIRITILRLLRNFYGTTYRGLGPRPILAVKVSRRYRAIKIPKVKVLPS